MIKCEDLHNRNNNDVISYAQDLNIFRSDDLLIYCG